MRFYICYRFNEFGYVWSQLFTQRVVCFLFLIASKLSMLMFEERLRMLWPHWCGATFLASNLWCKDLASKHFLKFSLQILLWLSEQMHLVHSFVSTVLLQFWVVIYLVYFAFFIMVFELSYISTALIRSNKAAISSFRRANGYEALRDPLISEDVCYQRYVTRFTYKYDMTFLN